MTEKLLEVIELNTWFYTRDGIVKAVRDVDFSLNEKDILGIVGESGCGKSVTAKSIIGLIESPGKIMSRKILYNGLELQGLKDNEMRNIRGKHIAYLMQNPMSAFNPMFTIEKHISDSIRIHNRISKKEAERLAIELLGKTGIDEPERNGLKYPHQLSGGMLQRAAIAMSISCNPKILIADEPTTALDVSIQSQILSLLKELRSNLGMSIIIITHNFGVVWDICDRVIVMYAGEIVESASAKDIYEKPMHPYTIALLSSVITMDMDKESALPSLQGNVIDIKDIGNGCDFGARCFCVKEYCMNNTPQLVKVEKDHFVRCHFAKKTRN